MVEGLQSGQSKSPIALEIAKKGLGVIEILNNWTKYFMQVMDTLKSLDSWQCGRQGFLDFKSFYAFGSIMYARNSIPRRLQCEWIYSSSSSSSASTAVCAIRSASRVSIANSKTLQNWKFQRYAASKNQSPPEQSQPQRHFDALASIQETSKVRLTQIPLTRLCDSASSLLLILLQHTDLLEGLHDLAVDTSTSIDVVRWTTASVASWAVNLSESSYTDGLAEVDWRKLGSAIAIGVLDSAIPTMARDWSGSDIEPIDRLRWKLLGWAKLDGINPTGNWQFTLRSSSATIFWERQYNQPGASKTGCTTRWTSGPVEYLKSAWFRTDVVHTLSPAHCVCGCRSRGFARRRTTLRFYMLGSRILTSTSRTEIPPAMLCEDGLAFEEGWLYLRMQESSRSKIDFRKCGCGQGLQASCARPKMAQSSKFCISPKLRFEKNKSHGE